MNAFSTGALSAALFALLFAVATGLALRWLRKGTNHHKNPGTFVAEVWLNWEICTGSTLYRARFHRRWQAAVAAKVHAMWLDWVLPTHYRAEYANGRPYLEAYGFAICFGVRQTTDLAQDRSNIWSPVMPGSSHSAAEHASAHPWEQANVPAFKGDLAGFKI